MAEVGEAGDAFKTSFIKSSFAEERESGSKEPNQFGHIISSRNPETMEDQRNFWRMLVQQDVSKVIALNEASLSSSFKAYFPMTVDQTKQFRSPDGLTEISVKCDAVE